jgi:polyhydroxybutyrate depolymerase
MSRIKNNLLKISLLSLSLTACSLRKMPKINNPALQSQAQLFQHGQQQRSYVVVSPVQMKAGQKYPLILALHGGKGTAENMMKLANFSALPQAENFIQVYPNAQNKLWQDGRTSVDDSDVKFIEALCAHLTKIYPIDTQKTFAVGMSNGGFMASRLACELPNIKAIAVVGASIEAQQVAANCANSAGKSVLYMMGTDDPLVPFGGGQMPKITQGGKILSFEATLGHWQAINQCQKPISKALEALNDGATQVHFWDAPNCKSGQVQGYQILGGGHTWPMGHGYLPEFLIGKNNSKLNASEVILAFFEGVK